jgi:hypothetical protein
LNEIEQIRLLRLKKEVSSKIDQRLIRDQVESFEQRTELLQKNN